MLRHLALRGHHAAPQGGFDGDLLKRLVKPESEEEAERRRALTKERGTYGNEVEDLVSRTKTGSELAYEGAGRAWTTRCRTRKTIGLDKVVIVCDARIAAKAAGLDQRPRSRREVVWHCETFGIDAEMCCNRQIRGFSAG